MVLYMEFAALASPDLQAACFPARFDFDNAKTMRPHKGAIKTFLEHMLIAGRVLVGQLVFDLTEYRASGNQSRLAGHCEAGPRTIAETTTLPLQGFSGGPGGRWPD